MLQDSIRRYVLGQELHDAACMVTLRDSLHFVDASVTQFHMNPPGQPERWFLSIKVIEPERAASVQWDSRPRNEYSSLVPDYASFILPVTDSTGAVWSGRIENWLQERDSTRRQRLLSGIRPNEGEDAQRVYSFLESHRAETNRVLARALRDPHEAVRSAAATVIGSLPSRRIDWRGSTADLRLLLGGTNIPAIETVFRMLARTEVAPDLAPALLHDNSEWVLDHLGSQAPMASDAAHSLLVRLNGGKDLERTRAAWKAWTSTL